MTDDAEARALRKVPADVAILTRRVIVTAELYDGTERVVFEHVETEIGPRVPAQRWPRPVPTADRRRRDRNPERTAEMVALALAGATVREIAEKYGLSYQRIQQVLLAEGVNAGALAAERTARRRAERAEIERARIEALTERVECIVCHQLFARRVDRMRIKTTCSTACAEAYRAVRYYVDPAEHDRQRRRQANTILHSADKYSTAQIAWAHRMLSDDPPAPVRRYRFVSSKASALVESLGLDPGVALVGEGPGSRRQGRGAPCAAVNLDGSPCKRTLWNGAELCHIHRAAAEGAPINNGRTRIDPDPVQAAAILEAYDRAGVEGVVALVGGCAHSTAYRLVRRALGLPPYTVGGGVRFDRNELRRRVAELRAP